MTTDLMPAFSDADRAELVWESPAPTSVDPFTPADDRPAWSEADADDEWERS